MLHGLVGKDQRFERAYGIIFLKMEKTLPTEILSLSYKSIRLNISERNSFHSHNRENLARMFFSISLLNLK
jgi:hypothetical protein